MAVSKHMQIGGHEFPYSEDTSILGRPVTIPGDDVTLKNAISVQPLEGQDGLEAGAPGEYTRQRYHRFFESGAGLVWAESIATREDGLSGPHALLIEDANLDDWKRFVDELKDAHPDVVLLAQLTHAGRFAQPHGKPEPVIASFNPHYDGRVKVPADYPVVDDDYLDRVGESFVHAADLCHQAGFDGVDVKACHGYLFSELLSCRTREGRYGGSFENRTRLPRETIQAIKAQQGHGFIVASRICHADTVPYPYGFGMAEDGTLAYDHTETLRFVADLHDAGVNLVNVSVGRVTVNPAFFEGDIPADTNEDLFERFRSGVAALSHAFPDMAFVGSGFSLMREHAPNVAAGTVANGDAAIAGFGRMALAYPGFADDMIAGRFDAKRACTVCGNCYKLLRALEPTGCPTRDRETYLPLLKQVLGK